MNKFEKLLNKLEELNLPDKGYAIYGSGPMAIRKIRAAHDLDIVVKNDLFKELNRKYSEIEKGFIKLEKGMIEIFSAQNSLIDNPKKVIDRAELINGLRFIKLDDLMTWKKKMGRQKDFDDIKLIKHYLKKQNK